MTARRVVGAALALAGVLVAGAVAWIAQPVPPAMLSPQSVQSLVIEDRTGRVLRATRASDGALARWTSLEEMDSDALAAFIAIEDHRFYRHWGVDLRSVARAVRDNLRVGGVVSGASTLTMQLARLIRPMDRTVSGKVVQALWALRLEAHLSKQQILEQYLNRVPLGQGAVGVPAAAALYYGAAPSTLSLGQAATLAGIARSPAGGNPIKSPARAAARRAVVLGRMVDLGFALPLEAERAGAEPVELARARRPFLAPHFTTQVLAWGEGAGRRPGGRWRTSVDLELQLALEREVAHTADQLRARGGEHAALVVLDNPTGEVLAWVGSPDFWADTAGQVDMVTSPRQPGSALKPFLYGLAFDRGYSPASVLPDIARTYQTASGPYHPRNYDRRYHGPVRAREALASSYNVPAIELTDRLGYATVLHTLHRAGFHSLDKPAEFYGLGLALGNGDVTLLELANAYRALANGGVWSPFHWEPQPAVLLDGRDSTAAGPRLFSPLAASLVLDILSDAEARVPGFGVRTPFEFPFRVAAKTGTSRHFTDNWVVGVTGRFTVAVWAGNFSGRPMEGVSGVSGAGPLLQRAILLIARRYPPGDFPHPSARGAQPAHICRVSGLLAGPHCPDGVEWFAPATVPTERCGWHSPAGLRLPAEYAEWAASLDAPVRRSFAAVPVAAGPSGFQITNPQQGDQYRIPPGVAPEYATLAFRAVGPAARSIRWSVDGRPLHGDRWTLAPGRHVIRAEAGSQSDQVAITVE